MSNLETQIARFRALFDGFENGHGRYHLSGKTRADGKLEGKGRWVAKPIADALIEQHLKGKGDGAGIGPLRSDNTCKFAVLDIDVYDPEQTLAWAKRLDGKQRILCKSKSGGAHVYLFFDEDLPGDYVQDRMRALSYAMDIAGCEVFPKQTHLAPDGKPNWINLPYYGDTRCALKGDGTEMTLDEFLDYAESHKLTRDDLDAIPAPIEQEDEEDESGPTKSLDAAIKALAKLNKIIKDKNGNEAAGRNEELVFCAAALHNAGHVVGAETLAALNAARFAKHVDGPLDEDLPNILKQATSGRIKTVRALNVAAGKRRQVNKNAIARYNADHAFISVGNKVGILRESKDPRNRLKYKVWSVSDFEKWNAADPRGTKDWIEAKERRSFINGFTTDPSTLEHSDGKYNLWSGWAVDPIAGDCSTCLELIEALCNGDPDHVDYVHRWIANLVQRPWEINEVALVFRGLKGTGKGSFMHLIGSLFGPHYFVVTKSSQLTGEKNRHLEGVIVLGIDEAMWAGDHAAESVLKPMITDKMISIRPLYLDAYMAPNLLNMIFAANSDWAIPASTDDRRWFVQDVPDSLKGSPLFRRFHDAVERERPAFLHWALNYDLNRYGERSHPRYDVPFTDALQKQVEISEEPWVATVRECLEAGRWPGTRERTRTVAEGKNARQEVITDPSHLLFPQFYDAVCAHAGGRRPSKKRVGLYLKRTLKWACDEEGLFADRDDNVWRCRRYFAPPLDEARVAFDARADWPAARAWQYHEAPFVPVAEAA
jgi:hypothetical protein